MNRLWAPLLAVIAGLAGAAVGELASEEIRTRLERIPRSLIRLAALRLPAELRTARREEWQAELHEILRGAESLPITRLVIATRFALGLLRTSSAIGRELSRSAPPQQGEQNLATRVAEALQPGGHRSAAASLPQRLKGFVGRSELMHHLLDPKAGARPGGVTMITGMPGIGKSSLAIEAAHQLADRFPDGQLYADLRGHRPGEPATAGRVLALFLSTLGVSDAAMPDDLEARAALFRAVIADKRVLIVLDDALSAAQIQPLIPGTGNALTLITSRSGLPGLDLRVTEQYAALSLLDLDESIAVLRDAIKEDVPDANAEELAVLAELCEHLPLALRILGGLARTRPLTSLVEELQAGLASPTTPRDNLRVALDLVYKYLPNQTARLLRLLSIQAGESFSVSQAARWAGISPARADEQLDLLVEMRLIRETRRGTYTMHDLVRAYACERAQADEPEPPAAA